MDIKCNSHSFLAFLGLIKSDLFHKQIAGSSNMQGPYVDIKFNQYGIPSTNQI